VGTICLFDISKDTKCIEIGYELMPKFQGQGIMKEALQSVIDFVFQTLKLNTILASTHFENQNSIALLSKFDFVKSAQSNSENPNLTTFTLSR